MVFENTSPFAAATFVYNFDIAVCFNFFKVCVNDIKALISGQWRALKPLYIDRFILLCVLNIANWSLSGYGAGYNLFA